MSKQNRVVGYRLIALRRVGIRAAAPLGTESVCATSVLLSWQRHFALTIPLLGCLSVILIFSAASATCV